MTPLEALEHDLAQEFAHYHVGAQLMRFGGTFLSALAVQLLAGTPLVGWADIRSVLIASAWTAFRQWRKTAPQQMAMDAIRDARKP